MKVVKFGGTSLCDAVQIKKICKIIISDKDRKVVVVSAPGKRHDQDIKVTDLLIKCADTFIKTGNAQKEIDDVIARFRGIAQELDMSSEIVDTIREDLNKRVSSYTQNNAMFMDLLKAAGEDNTAKLVAAYLKGIGVSAHYIDPKKAGFLLSSEYSNGRVLPETYSNLSKLRDKEGILIFPGFFGYSTDGDIVTFSRGGSDITGSILAAALDAQEYENFTDVDNVFVANPKIIKNARPISILTYKEMRELSYAGFSVFHQEALEPLYRKGIPVCIKSTNNPGSPGTKIVISRTKSADWPIVGIASDVGFCAIYVSKYLMNREIGFGRKLLKILEDEGLSYEHMPSGIDDVSVILRARKFDQTKELKISHRIKDELGADQVSVQHNLALVMIVGENMMYKIGIMAKVTAALAKANVNIRMINQGSSEVSMMYGINSEDNEKAVKAIYDEFFIK